MLIFSLFPFKFVFYLDKEQRVSSLQLSLSLERETEIYYNPPLSSEHIKIFLTNLSAFFKGQSPYLDLPHVLNLSGFSREVICALREIPRGETLTYADLAARMGNPRACRAVGQALAKNPLPLLYPCHRVVSQRGLGGYSQGILIKRLLLYLEFNGSAPPVLLRVF